MQRGKILEMFEASSDKEAEEHVNTCYCESDGSMDLYRLQHVVGWS